MTSGQRLVQPGQGQAIMLARPQGGGQTATAQQLLQQVGAGGLAHRYALFDFHMEKKDYWTMGNLGQKCTLEMPEYFYLYCKCKA